MDSKAIEGKRMSSKIIEEKKRNTVFLHSAQNPEKSVKIEEPVPLISGERLKTDEFRFFSLFCDFYVMYPIIFQLFNILCSGEHFYCQ